MKASIILLASFLSFVVLFGCESLDVKTVTTEAESKIIEKNDIQFRVSSKALCSSALTAIARSLAGNPYKLRALFIYCGWSGDNIEIMGTPNGR